MADDDKPRQTLTEAFQTILNLLPFHSEGQKNEVAETLENEVVAPLGRNQTEAGVVTNDAPEVQQGDAKTDHPFPTGGQTDAGSTADGTDNGSSTKAE